MSGAAAAAAGFALICLIVLAAPVFAQRVDCRSYQSGSVAPTSYGVAWNPFTSARELLLKASCDSSSAELTVGSGSQTQYIYKIGYIYSGSWQPFTMTGTFAQESDWIIGTGSYTKSGAPSGQTFWVAYVCHWINNAWKCGCRDSACGTPYWQLQTFTLPSGGTTSGGTTGGTTGGDTGGGGTAGGGQGSAPPGLFQSNTPRGTGTGIARAGANGVIDLTTSECFNKPAANIFEYPDGHYKRPFMVKGSVNNTYDLRGALFEGNPMQFPILFDDPHNTCVVGPTVVGQQPRSHTWDQVKTLLTDGDSVGWENSTGKFIIEGAWVDNIEDGVGMPFDLVPDTSTTWSIRHAYFKYIRDDVIENDGCLSGDLQDSFLDGVWTFNSATPSKTARADFSGSATLNVKDSIIRLTCMPDDRPKADGTSCGTNMGMGKLWKSEPCNLKVNMSNTVILVEDMRNTANFPSGTYNNVTLIWETGDPGGVPAGVTVTRSRDKYNQARASWIQRHGCDANAANCSFVHSANTNKTPPANTKPYVVLSNSSAYMPSERGGTIQWWTENVSQCKGSGLGFNPPTPFGMIRTGPRGYNEGGLSVSAPFNTEQQIMYGISCNAGGVTHSDSDRQTWFIRTSDTVKPGIPTNVKATGGSGKITLTWNESTDNFYIASYRIYRNNVWLTTLSSNPIFVDTSVTPGTSYSYQVEAFDSFGNLSGRSAAVSATAQ